MARKQKGPRANNLCRMFAGTELATSAVAGLSALEAAHKGVVTSGGDVGCGVPLDRCRQHAEPDSPRWDYVFTHRREDTGYGVEVHHADANEIPAIIAKKEWAAKLLRQCGQLDVQYWIWVASPPNGEILFPRQHPSARLLAEAGVSFPVKQIELP